MAVTGRIVTGVDFMSVPTKDLDAAVEFYGNVLGLERSVYIPERFFAEFETNLRRERQLEGIAKAKAAGEYKGRPASIEISRVRELKAQGMRPVDIAKALKIGRASVYRVLGQAST